MLKTENHRTVDISYVDGLKIRELTTKKHVKLGWDVHHRHVATIPLLSHLLEWRPRL